MHPFQVLPFLSALVPLVAGHGHILDPPARTPGDAFAAACGKQVDSQQTSDINGNVQGEMQVVAGQADYNPAKCNLNLCKGFQFADNTANVQSYTAGQTVDFSIQIAAPHTGVMNVSVVDTASNSVVGKLLIEEPDYASNAHTIPANNTAFSVTMPDVASQCGTAGACVLQWWWDAANIDQTYEGCVDFTMGGSGGSSSGGASTSVKAVGTATSSSAPTTGQLTTLATVVSSAAAVTTSGTATISAVPQCGKRRA